MPQGTFELDIRSNIRNLEGRVQRLGRQFDTLGVRGTANINKMNTSLQRTEGIFTRLEARMRRFLVVFASFSVVSAGAIGIGRSADSYRRFENSLRAITDTEEERLILAEQLQELAQENFISLEAAGGALLTFNATARTTGATLQDNLQVVETIAALTAGLGLSAIQTNTAYAQLGQSFSQQRVELENIKTLTEASPAIVERIRQGYELLTGDTRSLLEVTRAGELSGRILFNSLLAANEQAVKLRDNANRTFGQAVQQVRTSFSLFANAFVNTGNAGQLFIDLLGRIASLLEGPLFLGFTQVAALTGLLSLGLVPLVAQFDNLFGRLAVGRRRYASLEGELLKLIRAQKQGRIATELLGTLHGSLSDRLREQGRIISDYRNRLNSLTGQFGDAVKAGAGFRGFLVGALRNLNLWVVAISAAASALILFIGRHDRFLKQLERTPATVDRAISKLRDLKKAIEENTEAADKELEVLLAAEEVRASRRVEELRRGLELRRDDIQEPLTGARGQASRIAEVNAEREKENILIREKIQNLEKSLELELETLAAIRAGPEAYAKLIEQRQRDRSGISGESTVVTSGVAADDPTRGGFLGRNASDIAPDTGIISGATGQRDRETGLANSIRTNFSGAFNETGDNIVNSLDDSIRNAIENGGNFSDFGKFFEQQLTSALLQSASDAISNLISEGISLLFTSFGATGGAAAPTGGAQGGQFKFATGGFIRGPGTGTSDSINARLSNGEFVVNAQATRNNLGALHAINNGQNVSGGEVNVNNSFQLNGDFNEQSQQAIQQYMPDIADSVEYALRERGVIQ